MPGKKRGGRTPRRKQATKQPYKKVLITSEGEKSEPYYLNGLIKHHRITPASISIYGAGGSSPASVVKDGIDKYEGAKAQGDPYDKVFFVFDKDSHHQYENALDTIARQRPKGTFVAINSVPCFEYWLLLHFEYTTRPYQPQGRKSAADSLIKDLCDKLPNYEKAQRDLYARLKPNLNTAIDHAKRSLNAAQTAGTDNPSTRVHLLVEYLQSLSR